VCYLTRIAKRGIMTCVDFTAMPSVSGLGATSVGNELVHVDAILAAAICAGIARNIAELHYSNLDEESKQRYHVDELMGAFGTLAGNEQALSMMMSLDTKHNKAWLDNVALVLRSIYNVMARLIGEGEQNVEHASDSA